MIFRKKIAVIAVVALTGAILLALYLLTPLCQIAPWKSGEEILNEFCKDNHDLKESELIDILIVNSEKVCPVVCKKIKDKNMPHRRYAILFLGHERYLPAKAVLLEILSDETESELYRADALISLYQLDQSEGKKYAAKYQARSDHLGDTAKSVLKGESCFPSRRSFWNALSHQEPE